MESKVIAATHESLMAPDWANYVELSDTANANVSRYAVMDVTTYASLMHCKHCDVC